METDSIKKNLPQKRIFNLSDRIQKGMINFFGNKLDYQYMSITSPILEMKNEIDIDRLKECKKGFNREKLDDKQSGRKFI